MSSMLHIVRYSGPFGYIKPWTAVRDGETYSQQFLTPSIIEGMRQKLEVSAILRHRLRYANVSLQQEQTQPLAWIQKRGSMERPRSILKRGVLLRPVLYLAFPGAEDARKASLQHLCLCRNEDLIYPEGEPEVMTTEDFDNLPGFEMIFGEKPDAFLIGYNRFLAGSPMFGTLRIVGDPLAEEGQE